MSVGTSPGADRLILNRIMGISISSPPPVRATRSARRRHRAPPLLAQLVDLKRTATSAVRTRGARRSARKARKYWTTNRPNAISIPIQRPCHSHRQRLPCIHRHAHTTPVRRGSGIGRNCRDMSATHERGPPERHLFGPVFSSAAWFLPFVSWPASGELRIYTAAKLQLKICEYSKI